MDDEIDRKIYVTAILFLLVQNRQQTHDWTLIRSGANGLSIKSDKGKPKIQNVTHHIRSVKIPILIRNFKKKESFKNWYNDHIKK